MCWEVYLHFASDQCIPFENLQFFIGILRPRITFGLLRTYGASFFVWKNKIYVLWLYSHNCGSTELSVEETDKRLVKALGPPAVPPQNSVTLQYLLRHLERVAQSSAHSGLDRHALGLLFGPLLLPHQPPSGSVHHPPFKSSPFRSRL